MKPLPVPSRPWREISWDFITKLPPSGPEEATNLLIILDRLSKGVILIPMVKIGVFEVVTAFLVYYLLYYSLPDAIISDRGT